MVNRQAGNNNPVNLTLTRVVFELVFLVVKSKNKKYLTLTRVVF